MKNPVSILEKNIITKSENLVGLRILLYPIKYPNSILTFRESSFSLNFIDEVEKITVDLHLNSPIVNTS